MSEIGDEVFETESCATANVAASAKSDAGKYLYRAPMYDADRHVYVLIKARPRAK